MIENIITDIMNKSTDSADLYGQAILVTDIVKILKEHLDGDIIRFKNATFKKNKEGKFIPIKLLSK